MWEHETGSAVWVHLWGFINTVRVPQKHYISQLFGKVRRNLKISVFGVSELQTLAEIRRPDTSISLVRAARCMLPDLRFHCTVLKININQHHRHIETKTIAHWSKSKSKRKPKSGFPLKYYSNISSPIIKVFRHLACCICVLLINYGFKFDVCVTAHHWHNNINSQLDATIIILLIISISSACFGR